MSIDDQTEISFPTIQDISSRIVIIQDFGIVSGSRRIVGDIFGDHASGTDRHIVADLHIFDDADVRPDIDIIPDRSGMLLIASDGSELGKVAVVADDSAGMDDDGTAMGDIQAVADPGVAQDLYLFLGPIQSPQKKAVVF